MIISNHTAANSLMCTNGCDEVRVLEDAIQGRGRGAEIVPYVGQSYCNLMHEVDYNMLQNESSLLVL
jgi:hypothetical protein